MTIVTVQLTQVSVIGSWFKYLFTGVIHWVSKVTSVGFWMSHTHTSFLIWWYAATSFLGLFHESSPVVCFHSLTVSVRNWHLVDRKLQHCKNKVADLKALMNKDVMNLHILFIAGCVDADHDRLHSCCNTVCQAEMMIRQQNFLSGKNTPCHTVATFLVKFFIQTPCTHILIQKHSLWCSFYHTIHTLSCTTVKVILYTQ